MLLDTDWEWIDKIPGWMGRKECDWLSGLARMSRSWTDVGVYAGRSSMAIGLYLRRDALLQLVDVEFQPSFEDNLKRLQQLRPDLRISTFERDSVQSADIAQSTDVVFIDADHKYESVKRDILIWQDKAKILCGHDYQPNWAGVMQAVNELCPDAIQPVPDLWVR